MTNWLREHIIVSWILNITWVLIAGYWALDRTPPFTLAGYTIEDVRPGETTIVRATVKRDLHRGCSAIYSRYMYDRNGVKYNLEADREMSARAIEHMDQQTPDQLRAAVQVPNDFTPGNAIMVTDLRYKCNPLHTWWPIGVLMKMDVKVLP